jgi:hypothetical protein
MNPIQTTYHFSRQHKIPLSTDNQAMHRFEFPLSKGNSGDSADDFDSNFQQLMRVAPESINLSASLSPNQNFNPLNRLQEISPYVSFKVYLTHSFRIKNRIC